jgi:hypothetical protein
VRLKICNSCHSGSQFRPIFPGKVETRPLKDRPQSADSESVVVDLTRGVNDEPSMINLAGAAGPKRILTNLVSETLSITVQEGNKYSGANHNLC